MTLGRDSKAASGAEEAERRRRLLEDRAASPQQSARWANEAGADRDRDTRSRNYGFVARLRRAVPLGT